MDLAGLYTPEFREFCRQRDILLVILFGSCGTGRAEPGSDVDLAIQIAEPEDALSAGRTRRRLLRDFVSYLRTEAVDLVFLGRASPFVRLQVARTGRPLYEAKPGLFAGFCSRAVREQSDARVLEEAAHEYLRRVIEPGEPSG